MDQKILRWENRAGLCEIAWREEGIERFGFAIKKDYITYDNPPAPAFISKAVKLLDSYFSGKKVEFNLPLAPTGATDFRTRIWNAARQVKYGETVSYGQLAEMAGCPRAVRAAGTALGANPIPVIIPCHRILRSDGDLGGFALGLDVKASLLSLESKKRSFLFLDQ